MQERHQTAELERKLRWYDHRLIGPMVGDHGWKVDLDEDDLRQELSRKCWYAIERFDGQMGLDEYRFVRMSLLNRVKDLQSKYPHRHNLYIDGLSVAQRQEIEGKYFSEDEELAFKEAVVEKPLIPSTLTEMERYVLTCMYEGTLTYREIAESLDVARSLVVKCVNQIKLKFEDWRPTNPEAEVVELPPQEDSVIDEPGEAVA